MNTIQLDSQNSIAAHEKVRTTPFQAEPYLDVDHASESLLRTDERTQQARIMIVDDEPINIKVVQKYLRGAGYTNFVTTSDSREAIELIRREQPDVIVLDIMMPYVTGLNILEVIRGDASLSHLPVLILTAAGDDETKQQALEMGATDFLTKPVKPTELVPRIRNALVLKAHHDHMEHFSAQLADEVRQRTAELAASRQEVIQVLACAAEYRDEDTGNHVIRVGRYAGIIARELGFSPARVELIEQAAILHDVGKIGIPDAILLKPGKLTDEEFAAMQSHCDYGTNILKCVPANGSLKERLTAQLLSARSPVLRMAATIATSHHEKWNGKGYPSGLAGETIPIEGRITAVADVFDALGSRRPYKEPFPLERCLDIIKEGRGEHFDPQVVDAFLARIDEIVETSLEFADE